MVTSSRIVGKANKREKNAHVLSKALLIRSFLEELAVALQKAINDNLGFSELLVQRADIVCLDICQPGRGQTSKQ